MDVVKNQMSIPTYEKPMMEVMELEVEGVFAQSTIVDASFSGGNESGDAGGLTNSSIWDRN